MEEYLQFFFLIYRILLDYNFSIRKNLDYSLGTGLDNCERKCFCEKSHSGNKYPISSDYRSLVQAPPRKSLNPRAKPPLLLLSHYRAKY